MFLVSHIIIVKMLSIIVLFALLSRYWEIVNAANKYSLPQSEFTALHELYLSCQGENWKWTRPYSFSGYPWDFTDPTYSNPCSSTLPWQGVSCSSNCATTPCNVITLTLTTKNMTGSLPQSIGNFSQMTALSLYGNQLNGTIPETVGNLHKLTGFMLYANKLSGTIPNSIGQLLRLTYIDFDDNHLVGSIPTTIQSLTQLTNLILYKNKLTGTIPANICKFSFLRFLELNQNHFHGSIPDCIGSLTQLTTCLLYTNNLTSTIPTSIGNLHKLTTLYLHNNQLTGPIPNTITQAVALQVLYLFDNHLNGTIPNSIGSLTKLTDLILYENDLSGTIPDSIGELTQLTDLQLYWNHLHGIIPSSIGNLTNLNTLNLGINRLSGSIPDTIGNLKKLTMLSLYANRLNGSIPNTIGQASRLVTISLFLNFLSGTIPETAFSNLPFLQNLFLYSNYFHGSLPAFSSANFNGIKVLDFARNNFTGTLPASYSTLTTLTRLILNVNSLTGTIPSSYESLRQLVNVELDFNYLNGTIPSWLPSAWNQVQILYANQNAFTGRIPSTINSMKELQQCYFYGNKLTGTIPKEIGQLPKLTNLYLNDNYLNGSIPDSIGNISTLLNLRLFNNQLEGRLPDSLGNLLHLRYLELEDNAFTGTIPASFGNLSRLVSFQLSYTSIWGEIPNSLCRMIALTEIILDFNLLSGSLPSCPTNNATQYPSLLQWLSLNGNSLTGSLPSWFSSSSSILGNLTALTLSYNFLQGSIPSYFLTSSTMVQLALDDNEFVGLLDPNDVEVLLPFGIKFADLEHEKLNYAVQYSAIVHGSGSLKGITVQNNYLTGEIPSYFSSYPSILQLDLSNNFFFGTFPSATSQASYQSMQFLQLSNNSFSGQLPTGILRSSTLVAYFNDNQFTGSIPSAWFEEAPNLQAIILSMNCFTGTIPPSICTSQESLSQVIMDGLHSASSCSNTINAAHWLRNIRGDLILSGVFGTVPSCLFQSPKLLQLQLSGNFLDGSIPSNISTSVEKIILANNAFTGTIPSSLWIQNRNMSYLDISFNRFRDKLPSVSAFVDISSSISYKLGLTTPSFYLQDNRLSGEIPHSFSSVVDINLLEGNLFRCNVQRTDLPSHDPLIHSYDCGSDDTNIVLIIWGVLISGGCIALMTVCLLPKRLQVFEDFDEMITLYHQWSSAYYCAVNANNVIADNANIESAGKVENNAPSLAIIIMSTLFPPLPSISDSNNSNDHKMPNLHSVDSYLRVSLWIAWICLCVGLLCLLPTYAVLSSWYSTYEDSFIWILSASYLHGFTAAITLLCLYWIVLACVMGLIWYSRDSIFVTNNSVTTKVSPFKQIHANDIAQFAKYTLFLLINAVVVISVNSAYVYAIVNGDFANSLTTLLSILLSLFKIVWNSTVLGGAIYRHVVRPFLGIDFSAVSLVFISLFNNIVVPYLAEAFVSPDCFLYVLREPPKIAVSYHNVNCILGILCKINCHTLGSICAINPLSPLYQTTYVPSFHYSYQCSSALMTAFAHVFAYRYILSGIAHPILSVTMRRLRNWLLLHHPTSQRLEKIINKLLPILWRLDVVMNEDDSVVNKEHERLQKWKESFERSDVGKQLCVEIVTDLGIILSFGILFPPLIALVFFSMFVSITTYRLLVGRFLQYVEDIKKITTLNGRQKDCGSRIQVLQQIMKLFEGEKLSNFGEAFLKGMIATSILSAWFWSFSLFDTLGDVVGAADAYWIVLAMATCPVSYLCMKWISIRFIMRKQTILIASEKECHSNDEEYEARESEMVCTNFVDEEDGIFDPDIPILSRDLNTTTLSKYQLHEHENTVVINPVLNMEEIYKVNNNDISLDMINTT